MHAAENKFLLTQWWLGLFKIDCSQNIVYAESKNFQTENQMNLIEI